MQEMKYVLLVIDATPSLLPAFGLDGKQGGVDKVALEKLAATH